MQPGDVLSGSTLEIRPEPNWPNDYSDETSANILRDL
jgi:hypothetical protein